MVPHGKAGSEPIKAPPLTAVKLFELLLENVCEFV
jgi:hypothetical protein